MHRVSTLERANLTRQTSPPNSAPGRFPSYLLMTLLLYFFFIFYLSRCTVPDFNSVSSLASLPFSSCCHQATTTILHRICTVGNLFFHFFSNWMKYESGDSFPFDLRGIRNLFVWVCGIIFWHTILYFYIFWFLFSWAIWRNCS